VNEPLGLPAGQSPGKEPAGKEPQKERVLRPCAVWLRLRRVVPEELRHDWRREWLGELWSGAGTVRGAVFVWRSIAALMRTPATSALAVKNIHNRNTMTTAREP
jgi:hypothetical protein